MYPKKAMKVSNIRKRQNLSSMIESKYDYCPLIWMLCLKIDMRRVEKVQ